ncbi:hypothetical protein [Conexibacter arvalis]|uniref:Uncharacterized protein n=1 Tax=Conexibacter arvalis TaxID=912552 RepID=A0A840IJ43_9ACTN|nr:hypothetical protein [Conexibacter arvalis]MBB4663960.1 hypothetical protein [Conexibacter arvalis]
MEARRVDASGAGAPAQAPTRSRRGRWLRGGGGGADLVEQLEAEVALLREENARLEIRAARAGEARSWEERIRDLVPRGEQVAATDDQSWELLTECQLLRAALVDACREVEAAMAQIRGRLEALAAPTPLETAADERTDEGAP